ncbi:MAG: PEP-CTERM sorting domain-containing protein [Betaproteobacteria bacterium]|nr:PEP-CTERM sorting domain-containing protein [Betaproteobacteria bacterium]
MERGDYAWNGANGITFNGGALQGAPWRSTIGDWGLANTNILGVAISGDLMTLDVEGEGPIEFTRVAAAPVPEPGSFALMLAGAGLLGAAVRLGRRRP